MPSPFPGMDTYLENPQLWPEVHSRLIVAIADELSNQLSVRYRVAIEQRTYLGDADDSLLVGIPDVASVGQPVAPAPGSSATLAASAEPVTVLLPLAEEVQERYLEIREVATGAVITALEVLSPKNKRAGEGRQAYGRKRHQVLASLTHLVELDLLCGGDPLPMQSAVLSDYRILVSRSDHRPAAQLYAFSLRQPIPSFPVPLQAGEAEPVLNLQAILAGLYERGRYHLAIDYDKPAQPPLSPTDADWARTLLKH